MNFIGILTNNNCFPDRYKISFDVGRSKLPAQLAAQYYRAASLEKYADGMAYNQLGFLERQNNYGVEAVFYYLAWLEIFHLFFTVIP